MSYSENSILYYAELYKKSWKVVMLVAGISMFIAMLYSLHIPPSYVSKLTLLSAEQGSSLEKFMSFSNLSIGNSSNDTMIAILKSRRMAKEINEHFDLEEKSGRWWKIDTYIVTAGLSVEVRGPDPNLTQKIADWSVENLNYINDELDITTNKPMAKVLDPATYGLKEPSRVLIKMIAAGIFSFFAVIFYILCVDYFRRLKKLNMIGA